MSITTCHFHRISPVFKYINTVSQCLKEEEEEQSIVAEEDGVVQVPLEGYK